MIAAFFPTPRVLKLTILSGTLDTSAVLYLYVYEDIIRISKIEADFPQFITPFTYTETI